MNKREEWQSQYKILYPALESLRVEVDRQIARLIADASIAVGFPVQSRVKQWNSIATKIERVSRVSSLNDFQDLVGIRIIVLFKRDLVRVTTLIKRHFEIVREYDTSARLKNDQLGTQFGYSSLHFIVKLNSEWLTLPTLNGLGDLQAEIQLRTLPQHLWAMASEVLQYKGEADVPSDVRRSINRVSALLETVDLEFTRVLEQRDEYRTRAAGDDNAVLDVDSLEIVLDEILPPQNKNGREDYAELLDNLFNNQIGTPRDLRELWNMHAARVLSEEAIQIQNYIVENLGDHSLDEFISDVTETAEDYGDEAEGMLSSARRMKEGIFWNHIELIAAAMRA